MVKEEKFTLSQWRGIRGMSKADLSRETGITERTISSYESDVYSLRKANYDRLDELAKALHVSVNDIFLNPTSENPKFPIEQPV